MPTLAQLPEYIHISIALCVYLCLLLFYQIYRLLYSRVHATSGSGRRPMQRSSNERIPTQSCSSSHPSPQSLSPSHSHALGMYRPDGHRASAGSNDSLSRRGSRQEVTRPGSDCCSAPVTGADDATCSRPSAWRQVPRSSSSRVGERAEVSHEP